MKLKTPTLALLISVVLLGGIASTAEAGLWITQNDRQPAKFKEGQYAGEYNPEDIRGSFTFAEVSSFFEIDRSVLYQAFAIPEDTDGSILKVKDLEGMYGDVGIGTESIQVFTALYKNLPVELGDTKVPQTAVHILLEVNQGLTEKQREDLLQNQVALSSGVEETDNQDQQVSKASSDSTKTDDSGTDSESLIKGSSTVQQALDAGITKEQLQEVLGTDLPPANQVLRDFCQQNGLSFSEVKDRLNSML